MKTEALTVKEASEVLNVSDQTIRRMIKAGKMEYFKVGTHYRIKRSALNRFMAPVKK